MGGAADPGRALENTEACQRYNYVQFPISIASGIQKRSATILETDERRNVSLRKFTPGVYINKYLSLLIYTWSISRVVASKTLFKFTSIPDGPGCRL